MCSQKSYTVKMSFICCLCCRSFSAWPTWHAKTSGSSARNIKSISGKHTNYSIFFKLSKKKIYIQLFRSKLYTQILHSICLKVVYGYLFADRRAIKSTSSWLVNGDDSPSLQEHRHHRRVLRPPSYPAGHHLPDGTLTTRRVTVAVFTLQLESCKKLNSTYQETPTLIKVQVSLKTFLLCSHEAIFFFRKLKFYRQSVMKTFTTSNDIQGHMIHSLELKTRHCVWKEETKFIFNFSVNKKKNIE